jgi:hypothetical protein
MVCFVVLLLFSSANQYARLQFNSGMRYLVPLLPFLFLAVADRWLTLRRPVQLGIAAVVVMNAWVLTVFREPVHTSWRMFFTEGVQLPWLRVLRLTTGSQAWWWSGQLPAIVLLAVTGLVVWSIWHYGSKLEQGRGTVAPVRAATPLTVGGR